MKDLIILEEKDLIKTSNSKDIAVPFGGTNVTFRSKKITINGKSFEIDPRSLIRMIKQTTQSIGEYKDQDNPYSAFIISALRKTRADMVSALENKFGIYWQIGTSGESVFST